MVDVLIIDVLIVAVLVVVIVGALILIPQLKHMVIGAHEVHVLLI